MHIIDLLIFAAYIGGPILLGTMLGTIYSTVRHRRPPYVVNSIGHSTPRSIGREPDDLGRQIPATIRHYRRPPAFRAPAIRSYSATGERTAR